MFINKFNFLFCHIIFTEFGKGAGKSVLRVIGGRDAKLEEFPYVVRMELRTVKKSFETIIRHDHICTVSVVTPTWSLTAAHCLLKNPPPVNVTDANNNIIQYIFSTVIVYDSSNSERSDKTNFSRVVSMVSVPQKSCGHNDVGLLKTEPIQINSYGKISAVEIAALYGHEVWAMGYGRTNGSDGEIVSTLILNKPLQVVKVMLTLCNDDELNDEELQLCAAHKCGEPATLCEGDSGGPLVHSSGIVAISSKAYVSENCHMIKNKPRWPVVVKVSPISLLIDWIVNEVSQA